MIRAPELPCLPGFSVNKTVGQTKFHRSTQFTYIHEGVPYLTNEDRPGTGGRPLYFKPVSCYPSLYPQGQVSNHPTWVVFDKQVLTFEAIFKDPIREFASHNHIVHKCKLYYFLEDGTIKVVEPKLRDSCLLQGCIVKRGKIRIPGNPDFFYEILDLNVGKELEIYGKIFHLTDCDKYTRSFLNRLGIPVPDPIRLPEDPFMAQREQITRGKEIKVLSKGSLQKSRLKIDHTNLMFDAYWDDSKDHEGGFLHLLQVYYFLEDGTIEIKDITDPSSSFTLIKRRKLPKSYDKAVGIGNDETVALLNVIGNSTATSHCAIDPLNTGKDKTEYFTETDLCIGSVLNAYGRRVVLYDCNEITKEYYRCKYGLDDFTPLERPKTKVEESGVRWKQEKKLPPYNGYGSYEDSSLNCLAVNPFSAVKSYKQFYELDKFGYDSKTFRFPARMISKDPIDEDRGFTIAYYLSDDTISVFEIPRRNSGSKGGLMISRRKILKPEYEIYSSEPPDVYCKNDMFIGNTVVFDGFTFLIVGADEYTLTYMEKHPNEFPYSNWHSVLGKVKDKISSSIKEFVSFYLVGEEFPPVPFLKFRNHLKGILGQQINEQEIITLSRRFASTKDKDIYTMEDIQRYTHDELRRLLFQEFEKLEENFIHFDSEKKGCVSKKDAYTVLRGGLLPLIPDHIRLIIDRLADPNSPTIQYSKVIQFIDYQRFGLPSIAPVPTMEYISGRKEAAQVNVSCLTPDVDISSLIETLRLTDEMKQEH